MCSVLPSSASSARSPRNRLDFLSAGGDRWTRHLDRMIDRRTDLRSGMEQTLERLSQVAQREASLAS